MAKKAEDDYPKNQENPGPSQEALDEPNDEKAGRNINWTIIIAIIIMAIVFLFIFGNK